MDPSRYLELLEADAARISEIAAKDLEAGVPSCDGWTVRDVVLHLAEVYLHKVECMRRMARPEPWPPDFSGRDPVPLLKESLATLVDELRARGPEAPSYTWFPADQTAGFWYRRMPQETAVHRVDVELAHGEPTPVDAELAVDGVDELLFIMLAGDWSGLPVDEAAGKIVDLVTGDRAWRITLDRTEVGVVAGPSGEGADATVSGEPSDLLLWAWGRAPLDQLNVVGDREVVAALRRRFALATQ